MDATTTPRLDPGTFATLTKAQLRSRMEPCCDLKTRVWACLILHTGGGFGELAQIVKKGIIVPMRVPDIVKELREAEKRYYQAAGIEAPAAVSDWNLRRTFRELEQDGACERRIGGKPIQKHDPAQRKEIQIFVWKQPRKPDYQTVKRTRMQHEPIPLQQNLFDRRIMNIARQIQKIFKYDDPRVFEYLKLAESDPKKAEIVATALAHAAAKFTEELQVYQEEFESKRENLHVVDARVEKSDLGAPKKTKVGPGSTEKSDLGAPKIAPLIGSKNPSNKTTPSSSSVDTAGKVDDDFPTKDQKTPENQYPLTTKTIAEHDPAVTDGFVQRLAETTIKACENSSKWPKSKLSILNDKVLQALVVESFRTGPRNHGTGLLLKRVPQIAIASAPKE